MHEDYLDDAIPLDLGVEQIRLHVLSPLDLAVSKIARFADNDKEDIAELVRLGLTTADEIEQRALSALAGYVGGQAMLMLNLRDAVAQARLVEAQRLATARGWKQWTAAFSRPAWRVAGPLARRAERWNQLLMERCPDRAQYGTDTQLLQVEIERDGPCRTAKAT